MNTPSQQAELVLSHIVNDSDPKKELVYLSVSKAGHTAGFAIVDSTFAEDDKPSNEFRHIFLFPRIEVKVGEVVVISTGVGDYSLKTQQVQNKQVQVHFLFWNAKEPVWNNKGGDKARLITYTVVRSVDVPPTKKPGIKIKG